VPDVKAIGVSFFLAGLLLAVRVMFFGVQRRLRTSAADTGQEQRFAHRKWPLALAAFLATTGALVYARAVSTPRVTAVWTLVVVLMGIGAGAGAWWLVQRSASVPSSDPEDDPRYRFQGHVARIVEAIESRRDGNTVPTGRIAFSFDGKRHELRARWLPDGDSRPPRAGAVETEVVIERIEGEVAYVEPWTTVEQRL
jgi:hypothetical protein